MTRTKLGFVCFVAARNCMRQQVAGRSSQRHATLPTYYKVVHRTEKVLLCITLYYKVLIQYYSVLPSTTPVLQSATPVLLCTTNYYSSTTLYYKVLLQYYSVLQSTTPVLLRTTQYYSSTTPVLLCTTKYYSGTRKYCSSTTPVLQSTTPVLICKVPSHMTRYLQCAEQQESASNFSKYCACHEKWISCLILVTHETLFTMRGGTSAIVQTHQILRLPRKMNLMIDPCHTWNAIYNARSNTCHCPNSPNTAPATKNDSPKFQKHFSKTDETSITMRDRSENDPSWIRAGSELDPSRKPSSATRLATEVTFQDHHEHFVLKNTTFRAPAIIPNFTEYCTCHEKWHFNFTEYCACHAKWLASLILITCHTSFTMRSATALTLRPH